MIKIHSKSPTEIHFVCNSQDEIDFCETHKDSIFNQFIDNQTRGRFKTLEEFAKWYYYSYSGFSELDIIAKWNQTEKWGLGWCARLDRILQDMFNEAYDKRRG
jgi:hypothetical protein